MHARMNETRDTKTAFDETINFGSYGLLKYGTCIGAMLVAAWLLYRVGDMVDQQWKQEEQMHFKKIEYDYALKNIFQNFDIKNSN